MSSSSGKRFRDAGFAISDNEAKLRPIRTYESPSLKRALLFFDVPPPLSGLLAESHSVLGARSHSAFTQLAATHASISRLQRCRQIDLTVARGLPAILQK